MMKLFARGPVLALGLVAGFAASPVFAADQKNAVVAVVNGSEIHISQLADFARQLPRGAGQPPYEALLEIVINNQLVYDAAKKEKLDANPEIKAALKKVEMQMVTQAYMQNKVRPAVTEESIKANYDRAVKEFVPAEEVRARHILVETDEAARSIIAELGRGADFAELAKTRTKDPSGAANGGDLGYFSQKAMVPEFADAAFAMRPGEVSKTPVKSPFGYHVIKVDDKRMAVIPPYEQAKPAIAQQIAEGIQEKLVMDLRDKAKIKRFGPDGAPLPEQGKK
ncbi:MAG: peptidylprolyl isomerase [Phaeospirillum sp.]|nr:peptidylprolyl isomerase [Phaeospirillum sp.]